MSKKDKQSVVNNIKELNLEIDYDKLAEAIVKAQKKATESEETEKSTKEKRNLFVNIGRILRGERSKDGRMLSAPFEIFISSLYRTIAIMGCIMIVIFNISAVIVLINASWQDLAIISNIISIILTISISFLGFLVMVLFWGAANEIEHEKDKNYIIGVFSGIVSVAALIVAIIALYKSVG